MTDNTDEMLEAIDDELRRTGRGTRTTGIKDTLAWRNTPLICRGCGESFRGPSTRKWCSLACYRANAGIATRKDGVPSDEMKAKVASIRRRRKGLDWSQQELARRAECSISMVALLEKGFTPVSSAVLERVEAVLNDGEAGAN